MSELLNQSPTVGLADQGPKPEFFDIGGRRLATTISGEGPFTVILETGLGAESDEWRIVQDELAKVAKVVRYDRANRGLSDPAQGPRSALAMMKDLERLLDVGGAPGPLVLVGQSFGGLLMRLFAHHHPKTVAGLVLVDSLQRDQFKVFGALFPPPFPGEPPGLAGVRAFWTGGWRDPMSTTERIDMPASLLQDAAASDLGDLPIRVLVAAASFLKAPQVPPPIRPALQTRWDELQRSFLDLSSRTRLEMVEGSGHFIQRDAPSAIIAAVLSLIVEVTSGGPPLSREHLSAGRVSAPIFIGLGAPAAIPGQKQPKIRMMDRPEQICGSGDVQRETWWTQTSALAGPLANILAGLADTTRAALEIRLRETVRPFVTAQGLEFPGVTPIASARRA